MRRAHYEPKIVENTNGEPLPAPLATAPRMLASCGPPLFRRRACPSRGVDVSFGFPSFTMVGLPDTSVRESRERVRLAIRNSGFEYPPHRITVNLSPADVRKAGAAFDLADRARILAASGVVESVTWPIACCSASCRSTDRSR